jgi:hypothetical protein
MVENTGLDTAGRQEQGGFSIGFSTRLCEPATE